MADAHGAKRSKPFGAATPAPHKRLRGAYVANLVSLEQLRHFVHLNGEGEAAVLWVAGRQLALITVPQLHLAGIGRGGVRRRRENGTLHRMYRGVYLVGHPTPVPGAVELGAVLSCGDGAFVSYRSAAALWGLVARAGDGVDIAVVGRRCRSREGLWVHAVEGLAPADRGDKNGIPVTSPARTVVDFAAIASRDEAERAIAEACALKLTNEQLIRAAGDRAPNRPGVAAMRAILGQPGGPRRTRSDGERELLRLIRAARLPVPATDVPLLGFTADYLWAEQRVIVELDSYPAHGHRAAFERDHRRDVVHRDAGYEVLRFTGRQLKHEPFYVVAVIARALDRRTRG
jgi:very-short-patch-repair endonuclease